VEKWTIIEVDQKRGVLMVTDKSTKITFESWKMLKECLPAGEQMVVFISEAIIEKIQNDLPIKYDQYQENEKLLTKHHKQ
jgi:predicted nucleic acid-binding OB-fold protein